LIKKFFFIFILLLFSVNSFAYDDSIRAFVINDFSKGLNSHISEFSVPNNQFSIVQNVRFNKKAAAVSKRDSMVSGGSMGSFPIKSIHRYYKSDGTQKLIATGSTKVAIRDDSTLTYTNIKTGLTDGARWQWVTYHDVAIGGNSSDNTIKYDGKTQVTANTDGSRTSENLCADLGAPFAELNTGANLDASSWYQYKVAFYDGSTYSYSTARSNAIQTGSTVRDITLTDIPIGPEGTTHRYIYRTVGDASKVAVEADNSFYLAGTIADNSTLTWNDTVTDAVLLADAAPTWLTVSAGTNATPPKCEYFLLHNNRLFCSGNTTYLSRLYWSDAFNPDYFDSLTGNEDIRLNAGDKITFIKDQYGIICIGKTNTISKFYTEEDDDSLWYSSDPFSFVGCPAPYSVDNTPKGLFYVSRDGIYTFDGHNSYLISDAVTKDIRDIQQTNIEEVVGKFSGAEYHLAYTSDQSGEAVNNRVLVYDITRDAYALDTKNINCFEIFNAGTDSGVLYVGSSNSDGYVFANTGGDAEYLIIKYKSDFEGGTFDDARVYNTESDPIVELAWDCTIDGWLTELQTKNAGISTLNDIATFLPSAIIDRPDTDGTWTSGVYKIDAGSLDKLYWNESLGSYGNVTLQIRTGGVVVPDGTWTAWSSEYSAPSGSDISSETANTYIQLRANLSTNDIDFTPNLYLSDGFVIKMSYYKIGSIYETSILSNLETGWLDFGISGYKKIIEKIKVYYQGTSGTLTVGYKNEEGDINYSFDIDMSQTSPADVDNDGTFDYTGIADNKIYSYYSPSNSFSTPSPIGQYWKFYITDSGISEWTVDKIEVLYRVIPIE